ncbi:MAG: DinB family protein [Reichenbachiella sp.]|uniref:DinB family protein n=1 Tax=Reichenbachiella sp. TaxID=2184521 RepID=UPI0032634306
MQELYTISNDEQIGEIAISSEQLLESWLGQRRLTRKTIEAFPELELLTFSIGRLRPMSRLATEMVDWVVPTLNGLISGEWEPISTEKSEDEYVKTKQDLLQLWDDTTGAIEILWRQIPPRRFQESEVAFERFEGPLYQVIQYMIDNEIHHRGQAYVYLRVLGITPPDFQKERV